MRIDGGRIAELRRRVEADPASIAFAQLAEEYRRAGDCERAVIEARAGLGHHPGYLSARITLGRALTELRRLDEAQAEFDAVLRTAPENLAAIRGLAEVYQQRGELDSAVLLYKRALGQALDDDALGPSVDDPGWTSAGAPAGQAASGPPATAFPTGAFPTGAFPTGAFPTAASPTAALPTTASPAMASPAMAPDAPELTTSAGGSPFTFDDLAAAFGSEAAVVPVFDFGSAAAPAGSSGHGDPAPDLLRLETEANDGDGLAGLELSLRIAEERPSSTEQPDMPAGAGRSLGSDKPGSADVLPRDAGPRARRTTDELVVDQLESWLDALEADRRR